MSKIIAAIRKEVVVIAGAVTAALNVVLANGHVLSAIIPVVLSLIVRSQVSPGREARAAAEAHLAAAQGPEGRRLSAKTVAAIGSHPGFVR